MIFFYVFSETSPTFNVFYIFIIILIFSLLTVHCSVLMFQWWLIFHLPHTMNIINDGVYTLCLTTLIFSKTVGSCNSDETGLSGIVRINWELQTASTFVSPILTGNINCLFSTQLLNWCFWRFLLPVIQPTCWFSLANVAIFWK